ncbi:hypothetical protein ACFPME_01855 [Rhodanobacter umsongensis]|uniref:Uncharacterized protein n=1 Tax=Rhodanobacter umsongensis TaxID=633153 RepID=A0ABW0JHK7_9GAMM
MIDTAELKPRIELVLPMTEAISGHDWLEGGRKPSPGGKIVIDVTGP